MNWQGYYKHNCVTAEKAISNIKSGSQVVFGHAIGEPAALISTLVKNREKYKDVEIVHMVCMSRAKYCQKGMEKHFRHNALFVSPSTRDAIYEGRGDYTPCYFSEIPDLFKSGKFPVDTALIQVSPPDKHGYCSLGVSVDYTMAAAKNAKLTIAQVNEFMPRTLGDSFLHVSDIDYFVEANNHLVELKRPKITDIEKSIGENCASLIEDGSTLQLGIGAIPDAVLLFLNEKKDLGIHSEMISDCVMDLIESGVITGKRKTLHKGKVVITFIMGTQDLYDYIDDNPFFYMAPVNYINNPLNIMKNHKMVSINSCVQVDFLGQVNSESIGLKQISAVGGQVDFIRGSNMAKEGKSIIAIPSTTADKKISKIIPFLNPGSAVTTNRNDVNYIVTEYGIASLKGRTVRDRARALIDIAHPDFREQLIEEWEKRFKNKYNHKGV